MSVKTDIIAAVINMGKGGLPGSGLSPGTAKHSFEDALQALGTLPNQQKPVDGPNVPGHSKGETVSGLSVLSAKRDMENDLEALFDEDGDGGEFDRIPWLLFFLPVDILEKELPGMEGGVAGALKQLLAKEVPEELVQQWNGLDDAGRELAQALLAGELIDRDGFQAEDKWLLKELESRVNALQLNDTGAFKPLEKTLVSNKGPEFIASGDGSKDLSPQAAALLVSYSRQGRSLDELPKNVFQDIKAFFTAHGFVPGEESPENPASSLITRVEQFIRSLLLGHKETADQPGSFQGLLAEQLEEKTPGMDLDRPNVSNLFRSSDDILALVNSRADSAAPRSVAALHSTHTQPQHVLGQIVERMHLFNRPGEQEIRIRLHPEILGEVLIRMRRVQGVLSAEIQTQNVAVKDLIESQLDSLRQRFQQMDLNVEEFHVSVGDESRNGFDFDGETADKTGSYMDSPSPVPPQPEILLEDEPPGGQKRVNVLV